MVSRLFTVGELGGKSMREHVCACSSSCSHLSSNACVIRLGDSTQMDDDELGSNVGPRFGAAAEY